MKPISIVMSATASQSIQFFKIEESIILKNNRNWLEYLLVVMIYMSILFSTALLIKVIINRRHVGYYNLSHIGLLFQNC